MENDAFSGKSSRKPGSQPLELSQLTVAQVLARWPQTIPVFLHYHMACAGCVMAPFETVAEAASIYGLELSRFLSVLYPAIALSDDRGVS